MAFKTCAFNKNWLVIAVIVICLCTEYYCQCTGCGNCPNTATCTDFQNCVKAVTCTGSTNCNASRRVQSQKTVLKPQHVLTQSTVTKVQPVPVHRMSRILSFFYCQQ
jgi:hypothetical protein